MLDFDQYTEYVTEGPIIHAVDLTQHSLESPLTLWAVIAGYRHLRTFGRGYANSELALVFSEWSAAGGLAIKANVQASAVLASWQARELAIAYVAATKTALDAINTSRTTAVALIRMNIDGTDTPLSPDEPFTAAQVTALSTWINAHGITNAQFAALFDVTAAQLSNWLQTHPRWQFAVQLYERMA